MKYAFALVGALNLALLLAPCNSLSANLNSDTDFSIVIAVTVNRDDHIMGKLEYSNHDPQFPLQLVTFNSIGGQIFSEPYVFTLVERTIVSPRLHRIKCKPVNDKYGDGSLVLGTIDFRDELKPSVTLANEGGYTYLSNITQKGIEVQKQYIPNIWLGR